jgi:hypothetical protein
MEDQVGVLFARNFCHNEVSAFLCFLNCDRIGELFDIIADFPESLPAVQDLKECLNHTNQHSELVSSLKKM